MGDFKLKIDIAKPDIATAERGLKSIFKELEKIDKKAASVDRRMKRLGTGGKGGDKQGASSKFGGGGGGCILVGRADTRTGQQGRHILATAITSRGRSHLGRTATATIRT